MGVMQSNWVYKTRKHNDGLHKESALSALENYRNPEDDKIQLIREGIIINKL